MSAPAHELAPEELAPASAWLSRMVLNPRGWDVPADLRNPDAMHRRLCSLFPRDPVDWFAEAPGAVQPSSRRRRTKSRAEVSLLWRLEAPPHPAPPHVLFQATEAPRWDALPAGYARGTESKPIALPAIEGALFRFRLRANPTTQPEDHARRHIAVHGPSGRLEWLDRRATSWGFAVVGATERREPMLRFRRRPDEDPLKIVSCLFDGILRVTDPELFRRACVSGCGRGRPYGFGLLSLGRP
jgi:CRISPR system Cascade subunit CasE